ncbi:MAG: TIGR03808 family TAT-translocated repetitive protein [Pseudolabrys sp.]|jgi:uncharacterized secreted repeat protein (TIGR03808 family)
MTITRRRLIAGSLSGAACFAMPAFATPFSVRGFDAAHFGVRPGSPDDQSARLQRAIDRAARARVPLWLPPGRYRAGNLTLPAGAQLAGVRGATHLMLTRGPSLFSGDHADSITLSGLTLDGGGKPLPQDRGLVQLTGARRLRIEDCTLLRAGGNAITLQQCDGVVTGATITDAADNALLSNDSRGMIITSNTIRRAGNGGIRVFQSAKRHDGSLVADNTIEDVAARAGGSGQNGNAINVFRAADVIVRNNMIRRCAFTGVRGNDSNAIQILGNNCADFDETAMYAEFDFEGAVIADNVIDGAENGIAVTNFNKGGRLSSVHGNLIRNLKPRRPDSLPQNGIGISVEAETAATGNVVENAARAGLRAGYGPYLRNVTLTGNVVRKAGMGIQVSVVPGAGDATITGNVITGARHGAIVGMAWEKAVTGDLAKSGAEHYPQLTIANNKVR